MILYIEAKVIEDKPGILAKITSILAKMNANIAAFTTGIEGIIPSEVKPKTIRMLISVEDKENLIQSINEELKSISEISITNIRKPTSIDVVNLKYGLESVIASESEI
ncbi:MAG: ACT domain-containing protein [Candidatus Calescibacterium sp.]|nr:ACT domain-containing protein [Candidatus Calescibacterium sp.]MDW8133235.1 ACT domain-containing protein [Candidatus Calescibacterium sp.]